jgi:hypothetical protein
MFLTRGESEFEVSIRVVDNEWEGKIVEHNLSRVVPTVHLCHNWRSLDDALAGMRRRWRRLFPDEGDADVPDFHEALDESALSFIPSPCHCVGRGRPV